MSKNLEIKVDFDICINYCNKSRCDKCHYGNNPCPFLEAKILLHEMATTIVTNKL